MAHNPRVAHELRDVSFAELSNHSVVKGLKCRTEIFTLAQNGEPRQTRLKTFETNLFEECSGLN